MYYNQGYVYVYVYMCVYIYVMCNVCVYIQQTISKLVGHIMDKATHLVRHHLFLRLT